MKIILAKIILSQIILAKIILIIFLFFAVPVLLFSSPLYSPTWGFWLDLPEDYTYVEGNDIDRYSFQGPNGAMFDMAVYAAAYQNIEQMTADINRRLGNTGDTAFFAYADKAAALLELRFNNFIGWGLCVELGGGTAGKNTPFLLALAYAPANKTGMDLYHLSALDSIAPSEKEKRLPGPVMEFSYPRGQQKETAIAGTNIRALIREHDAEAAQALIDREFSLLSIYQNAPRWQEAWIRFYRMIYRDSQDRAADAVSRLVQNWNKGAGERAFAEKTLAWLQGFVYERDLAGSDFVNIVSAITEGRGDCDSRAMLYAMILARAQIPAAMMVSRTYSHAMGLADISGSGARFESGGIKWLVAETTKAVAIGLIGQDMSNPEHWLGVLFE